MGEAWGPTALSCTQVSRPGPAVATPYPLGLSPLPPGLLSPWQFLCPSDPLLCVTIQRSRLNRDCLLPHPACSLGTHGGHLLYLSGLRDLMLSPCNQK